MCVETRDPTVSAPATASAPRGIMHRGQRRGRARVPRGAPKCVCVDVVILMTVFMPHQSCWGDAIVIFEL